MAALALFFRLMLRPAVREPGRSLLVIAAVAIGAAVVLAIDLAGNAAAGSFRSSMETLSGENDLEITAAGGVPESIVGTLARAPYPLRMSPRIEAHATVAATGESVPLIGVDLIGLANDPKQPKVDGGSDFQALDHINDPDAVLVTPSLSRRPGEKIALLINDQTREYAVRGIIPESRDVSGSVVVMDIGTAEAATGRRGRIDRILLKTPDQPAIEIWEQRIRSLLPTGVTVVPQGAQTEANRKMLAAFRWNLRILSYIALLVGAFLIYNAISVSVVRRRAEIGTVRAGTG